MKPMRLADLDWDNKTLISGGCFGGEVYKSKLLSETDSYEN